MTNRMRLFCGTANALLVVALSLAAHLPHAWPGALVAFCVGYIATFITSPQQPRPASPGPLADRPLTDDDRAWLAYHDTLASSGAGQQERHYLACGHQVGGRFDDLTTRDCETCNRYLGLKVIPQGRAS